MDISKFYVITPVSNPVRFNSRYKLYNEFAQRVRASGANLVTVEMALGDRPFAITPPTAAPYTITINGAQINTPNQISTINYPPYPAQPQQTHVQLRSWDELWHKENMINIAISRLPQDWQYVAWVDADVQFMRPDWITETAHQLQHHMVVQMWQSAVDMGPDGQALNTFNSFAWCYKQGLEYNHADAREYYHKSGSIYWHPGFAWAARREAIDHLGGLLDRAILGAGDHHMALALVNKAELSIPKGIHSSYAEYIMNWQHQAEKFIRRDIGYVAGTLMHHWHGKKVDRRYWSRWDILKEHLFNPVKDLKRDWQGLYQLVDDHTPRFIGLRDGIRQYFRQRNEDSVDL